MAKIKNTASLNLRLPSADDAPEAADDWLEAADDALSSPDGSLKAADDALTSLRGMLPSACNALLSADDALPSAHYPLNLYLYIGKIKTAPANIAADGKG